MSSKSDNLFKMDAVEVYKLVIEGKHISRFPPGYWKRPDAKENAAKCTKYLIEHIVRYSGEDIKEYLGQDVFSKNHLRSMLLTMYKDSPYNALNAAYPGAFDKKELKGYRKKIYKNKIA